MLAGAVHGGGAARAGGERVKVGRWGVWLTSVLDTVISDMVQYLGPGGRTGWEVASRVLASHYHVPSNATYSRVQRCECEYT